MSKNRSSYIAGERYPIKQLIVPLVNFFEQRHNLKISQNRASYIAGEPCPTNFLSNVPLVNFLEKRQILQISQNRVSHIALEHNPTNHLLNVPLVHFLERKEAHSLDKVKQCIIYIRGKLIGLHQMFCSGNQMFLQPAMLG